MRVRRNACGKRRLTLCAGPLSICLVAVTLTVIAVLAILPMLEQDFADYRASRSTPLITDLVGVWRSQREPVETFDVTQVVRRYYPKQVDDFEALRTALEQFEGMKCTRLRQCIRSFGINLGCSTNVILEPNRSGKIGVITGSIYHPCQ